MVHKPMLRTPLLYAIGAGIAWTLNGLAEPRWLVSILYLLTFAAIGGCLLSGVRWIVYTVILSWKEYQTASVAGDTARLDKLIAWNNSVAAMDSDHLAYANKIRPTIRIIPGHNMPPTYILLLENGVEVPMTFVHEFCALSSGDYLVERRRWSEGSAHHKWADAFTLALLRNSYATDAKGNHAAKWISAQSREAAFISYGYLTQEE